MKKNFASTGPGGLIKSEPRSSNGSNSLDFETGQQDFACRIPETGPIKCLEIPSMNDTLEHLRALCLQQAASDVQRACRQLCISSNPLNWNTIDVQNWLQYLSNERKIDACWKNLDFLMKITGSDLVKFCENSRTWMNMTELQSVHVLVMDKISANLDIWRSAIQTPHFHQTDDADLKFEGNFRVHSTDNDIRISSELIYHNYRRPSSIGLSEESDEEPSKPVTTATRHHIHLWQFLRQLLSNPQYTDCIRWVDRKRYIFKIENSVQVAKLWGQRKNRPAMNYDKLSRSIRQYYRKGIMRKTERAQRLVYQFCGPSGVNPS